jgi:CRP/FNR family cyclic AMP-dependent transcriptional regulator
VHYELTNLFRKLLLSQADVGRLTALGRRTRIFGQGDKADSLYFIEEGLIKVTRTNTLARRPVLSIYGPNDLVGEESLSGGIHRYSGEAEVLSRATLYQIPWTTILCATSAHPELTGAFLRCLVESNERSARKIELLCLHDVETRILDHLRQLAKLVKPAEQDSGYPLPITQLELADLVGATRETISTTLNRLEKRGFVKLSRRLLTVYLPHGWAASAGGNAYS